MSDEKAADEVVLNGKEEPKKSAKQDDADKQVEKAAKKDDKEPTQAKLSEAKSVPEPGIEWLRRALWILMNKIYFQIKHN